MWDKLLRTRAWWARPCGGALVIAAALLIPVLRDTKSFTYGVYSGIAALIVVIVGLNIAMGMAGQFLLGIVAVFATAGYATGWVVIHHPGMGNLFLMCVTGAVAGGVAGLVIGLPALRVGEFYLALVSLYAALVVPSVANEWNAIGGAGGLTLFTLEPKLAGFNVYAAFVGIILLMSAFAWATRSSTVGRRFAALAASEELAAGLGISGYGTKLLGSVLGSVVAGVAGGMYVYSKLYFGPTSGGFGGGANLATLLLAALIIGGSGTVIGPVIGGVLILGLNQALNGLKDMTGVIFGALLVVFSIFVPEGIAAELGKAASRLGLALPSPERQLAGTPAGVAASAPSVSEVRPTEGEGPPANRATAPAEPVPAGSPAALEIVGVARTFGGVRAVDGVDLRVEPGTVHGLIGSNGSGKTTLLNLISGFYRVDAGEIRLGPTALTGRSADAVTRLGVARTFQTPKLILDASVLDNVMPAAERDLPVTGTESVLRLPRGVRATKVARGRAFDALAALHLEQFAGQRAGTLPHGTRRLVEVARAMALKPRFLLVDEPAAGLSPTEADRLVAALSTIAGGGVGVLLIEHNVPLVLALAHQVTVLHQGKKLFDGTPTELRADEKVAGAFLGIDVTEAVG